MASDFELRDSTALISIPASRACGNKLPDSEPDSGSSKQPDGLRRYLLGVMLMVIFMFMLKFLAASLIDGEQIQPLLDWFDSREKVPAGIVLDYEGAFPDIVQITPRFSTRYQWQPLPSIAPDPADNLWSKDKAQLGERLFFDINLSHDRSVSCASCHDNEQHSGADGRTTAVGVGDQVGPRNTPTVWNSAFQQRLFWDGRATSLEEQAIGPLLNPIEMAMPSVEAVVARVKESAEYEPMFEKAFGTENKHDDSSGITIRQITAAIAAYQRTLITPNTPYDRYVRGESEALSVEQLKGMALFEELGCINCHSGPNFSGAGIMANNSPWRIFPVLDTQFEPQYHLTDDVGKAVAGSQKGVWRIPSLRNVAKTGPYLHNGSVTELAEVVRIMASAQLGHRLEADLENQHENTIFTPRSNGESLVWSAETRSLIPIEVRTVTEEEVAAIVVFLESLNGELVVDYAGGRSK